MIDDRRAGRGAALFLMAGLVLSCAQPAPPPGGTPDREAPRLVSTRPEHGAIVPGLEGSVVFSFDEKLSEKGPRDPVLVSPETGRPVIERDGSELKVRIQGGWKPNLVYRVIITPGIQDRFNNSRRDPTELVFSTGPELLPTAIAGLVTDRVTGRPLAEARVVALDTDSTIHSTVTDTAGFFGLRYLPSGNYQVFAYEDQNRNGELEYREKQAQQQVTLSARDTQVVTFAVLPRDSTPARLTRAEARDSVEVRLNFDDHIDQAVPLGQVSATLFQMPDSTVPISSGRLMHVRDYEVLVAAQAAADTGRAAARPTPPAPGGLPADTVRRPTQELVLLLDRPLAPSTRYRVTVSGITNLNDVPNGGGTANFTTRARAARDTSTVKRDTLHVRH
ncbi:MAG: Ig-like domain-containing protein [Gemmatimonadota bacterium]